MVGSNLTAVSGGPAICVRQDSASAHLGPASPHPPTRGRPCSRALGFCVSQRHADFMARFFLERDVQAVAVHAGPSSSPRAASLERLQHGDLRIIFAVDIFNEGVDVPTIDTVLMLRPTESKVVWLQQLGRGLRKVDGKPHLVVIDYIGNHRTFLQAPGALFPGTDGTPGSIARLLDQAARHGTIDLGHGCYATYELEAIDILRALVRLSKAAQAVEEWYRIFKDRHLRRPSASELWHAGYDPGKLRKAHGGWFEFVQAMGDLSPHEIQALQITRQFLLALESTELPSANKMVLLLAMIGNDAFPGSVGIDDLVHAYAMRIRRSAHLRADAAVDPDDLDAVRQALEKHAIAAWTGGKGTGGTPYFRYDRERGELRTTLQVPDDLKSAVGEMSRELAQWRLSRYLEGVMGREAIAPRIVCKVSHNSSGPILFLPSRDETPGIPREWFPVEVAGEPVEFKFVEVAVNVARRPGETTNVLPDLLRRMFGAEAGASGRHDLLRLELRGEGYQAVAVGAAEEAGTPKPRLWGTYMRRDIAPAFGLPFEDARWRQTGVVLLEQARKLVLLVTLGKDGFREEHRYADRFLSPNVFQWQSQNRTPQQGKIGELIRNHRDRGVEVHLFARRGGKTGEGTAMPFVYCGEVSFRDWEGEKPITVRWELAEPVPPMLVRELGIPVEP